MAYLDFAGLSRFASKLKQWIISIIGTSTMGTTADTLTGAIAEHSTQISALESVNPVLAVNSISPDNSGNVTVSQVDYAFNLVAGDAQSSHGEFIYRTTGGDASLSDGDAWISTIRGRRVHTGYVPTSVTWEVHNAERPGEQELISADINEETWIDYVADGGVYTFEYTSVSSSYEWVLTYESQTTSNVDLLDYGIEITGEEVEGDQIIVTYVKEQRGTIVTANPLTFVSTGWNLYNNDLKCARVIRYSAVYGFRIGGTYTSLEFSETVEGERTPIEPVEGWFSIPSDGYVWVQGGNNTDTFIYMTWSDWTVESGKVWEPYYEDTIDLSTIMEDFEFGLCQVGTVVDTIDFDLKTATSNIVRWEYNASNLEAAIDSGRAYETDDNYIYIVRDQPEVHTYNWLDGTYLASDHGLEFFTGTTVNLYTTMLYGQNLRDKLRTDVLTISPQDLLDSQKSQIRSNLGLGNSATYTVYNGLSQTNEGYVLDARQGYALNKEVSAAPKMITFLIGGKSSIVLTTSGWTRALISISRSADAQSSLAYVGGSGVAVIKAGTYITYTYANSQITIANTGSNEVKGSIINFNPTQTVKLKT